MTIKKKEEQRMTNKQTDALLESIKIIAENAKSTKEIIKALERIQGRLEQQSK